MSYMPHSYTLSILVPRLSLQSLTPIPLSDHRLQACQHCHTHKCAITPCPNTHITQTAFPLDPQRIRIASGFKYQDMPIPDINANVFYITHHIFPYL